MLHVIKDLKGLKVVALDQHFGEVEDILFDDLGLVVRYFVVKTGGWLKGRLVLISPQAIQGIHPESGDLMANLSKEDIEKSLPLEPMQPVPRPYEESLAEHYAWDPYWSTPIDPAFGPHGMMMPGAFYAGQGLPPRDRDAPEAARARDPHLQSAQDVAGSALGALDGDVGHVRDFMLDADDWQIKYLVVATGPWFARKPVVVIDRSWIRDIDWIDHKIIVALYRDQIQNAPAYDPEQLGATFASNLTVYYRGLLDRWHENIGWDTHSDKPSASPEANPH